MTTERTPTLAGDFAQQNGLKPGPLDAGMVSSADADGWIEWEGGANPVPGKQVEFRIRVPQSVIPAPSEALRWHHWGHRDDIIAFRLVEEASPVGGGEERKLSLQQRLRNYAACYPDHPALAAVLNEAAQALAVMSPRDEE